MQLPRASDHADRLAAAIAKKLAKVAPRLLYVQSFSSGLVTLKDAEGNSLDDVSWVGVFPPQPGDAVLAIWIPGVGAKHAAGSRVAIGPIKRATGDGTLVVQPFAQSFADTVSTTSTSAYVDAATFLLALPAGTWTVDAIGGLSLSHGASGAADLRLEIDAVAGSSRRTQNLSTAVFTRWEAHQTLTNVAGGRNVTIKVQAKGFNSGTTNLANPAAFVVARRVTT